MVVQATHTFFTSGSACVRAGQMFGDDDPRVAKYPQMFAMIDDDGTGIPLVESAERAPGGVSFARRPDPSPADIERAEAELAAAAEFAAAEQAAEEAAAAEAKASKG